MAFVTGGKHFGQYTFDHWYDHEYDENKENTQNRQEENPDIELTEENVVSSASRESGAGTEK